MSRSRETRATISLSRNVRRWRHERGMSLVGLAHAAGISKSTLSELEAGRSNPSLDVLWGVAEALRIPFTFLFEDHHSAEPVTVVHLADAPVIAAEGTEFVVKHMLGRRISGEIDLNIVTLTAGRRRESRPHGRGIVEHVLAIEGTVEVGPISSPRRLEPGDLISFPADQPHAYTAGSAPVLIAAIHEYPAATGSAQPASDDAAPGPD